MPYRLRRTHSRVEVRFPFIALGPDRNYYKLLVDGTVGRRDTQSAEGDLVLISVETLAADLAAFKARHGLQPAEQRPQAPLSPEVAAWSTFLFDLTILLEAARAIAPQVTPRP